MPEFQEYPKTLRHPGHKPARKIADQIPWTPTTQGRPEQWEGERYPDVIVLDADQEAQHAAAGYQPLGFSNPAAFSTAHASPHVPGRVTSEYPKMVNGVIVQDPNAPQTGFAEYPKWVKPPTGESVLVNSAAEETALRASWEEKPAEEPKGEPPVPQGQIDAAKKSEKTLSLRK